MKLNVLRIGIVLPFEDLQISVSIISLLDVMLVLKDKIQIDSWVNKKVKKKKQH